MPPTEGQFHIWSLPIETIWLIFRYLPFVETKSLIALSNSSTQKGMFSDSDLWRVIFLAQYGTRYDANFHTRVAPGVLKSRLNKHPSLNCSSVRKYLYNRYPKITDWQQCLALASFYHVRRREELQRCDLCNMMDIIQLPKNTRAHWGTKDSDLFLKWTCPCACDLNRLVHRACLEELCNKKVAVAELRTSCINPSRATSNLPSPHLLCPSCAVPYTKPQRFPFNISKLVAATPYEHAIYSYVRFLK